MNSRELKQEILSEPHFVDDKKHQEINKDPELAEFHTSILELDQSISEAMNIDIPEKLQEKLNQIPHLESANETQHSNHLSSHISLSKPTFALAASILFTVGLTAGQINWGNLFVSPANAQVEQLITHIEQEQSLIPKELGLYNTQQINHSLKPYGYQFTQRFPYPIRYLNNCGFVNDGHALHMQFQGPSGSEVVLFISHEKPILSEFELGNNQGLTYPIQNGFLVLVTQGADDLQKIAQDIEKTLTTTSLAPQEI